MASKMMVSHQIRNDKTGIPKSKKIMNLS